jgi:hypothetical protein
MLTRRPNPLVRLALLVAALGGCAPSIDTGCRTDVDCPTGAVCFEGRCRSPSTLLEPDAAPPPVPEADAATGEGRDAASLDRSDVLVPPTPDAALPPTPDAAAPPLPDSAVPPPPDAFVPPPPDAFVPPPLCVDYREEDRACGLNGRGQQAFVCRDETWVPAADCVDPDACVDATQDSEACGNDGIRRRACEAGQWTA